jgi:hypothetical protein
MKLVKGKTNRWIQNFLAERKQVVVVEGEKSDSINVESGVPQGSVLKICLLSRVKVFLPR